MHRVFIEEDEKLKSLKEELGDDVHIMCFLLEWNV
jgi:hypothetical protein